MKNTTRIILFLIFLLFPLSVFAEVCAHVITLDLVQGGGACSKTAPTTGPPSPDSVNCPSTGTLVSYGNCTAIWEFCCSAGINQFEAVTRAASIVNNVPFGQEPHEQAENYL